MVCELEIAEVQPEASPHPRDNRHNIDVAAGKSGHAKPGHHIGRVRAAPDRPPPPFDRSALGPRLSPASTEALNFIEDLSPLEKLVGLLLGMGLCVTSPDGRLVSIAPRNAVPTEGALTFREGVISPAVP